MPSANSSVAAAHTAPRSRPSGTVDHPFARRVVPSIHRLVCTAWVHHPDRCTQVFHRVCTGWSEHRCRPLRAPRRPGSSPPPSRYTVPDDRLPRPVLPWFVHSGGQVDPHWQAGKINRAIHTRSTVVHIVVLRLSTPAPFVAAPSFPQGDPLRRLTTVAGRLTRAAHRITAVLTPSRPARTLERLPGTVGRTAAPMKSPKTCDPRKTESLT